MALIYQGINGPFVGKVGPVVGYLWKGKACMRAYNRQVNYPNTLMQQHQRDWFVSMVRFASKATAALQLGFARRAEEAQMTEGNYFVRQNKQHFHSENGVLSVDYSKLKIASGAAADVYFKSPRFEENETIVVEFEKNTMSFRASSSDKIYVYVYAPELEEGFLSAPVERRQKSLSMRLPQHWSGVEVHLYGFVIDREGRSSESTYIGVGCVNHYENRGRYIPINNDWKEFVDIASKSNGEQDDLPLQPSDSMTKSVDLFSDLPLHSPPE